MWDDDKSEKSLNSDSDDEDINDFWGTLPDDTADDDGDNDDGVDTRPPGAEHLLILVDCSPDMFEPSIPVKSSKSRPFDFGNASDDEKQNQSARLIAPIDAALQALHEHIRQNVRRSVRTKSGKRNGFGLTLFGTRRRTRLDVEEELEKRQQLRQKNGDDDDDDTDMEDSGEGTDREQDDSSDDSGDEDRSRRRRRRRPKSNLSSARTTVHHLIPLEPPGIDTIKTLRHCLTKDPYYQEEDRDGGHRILDLKVEFGHPAKKKNAGTAAPDANQDMPDGLLTALNDVSQTFRDAKCVSKPRRPHEKIGNDIKNIWIVTNQLGFCAGDENRQRIIKNTVNDLEDNGFQIFGWPLPNKNVVRLSNSFFSQIANIPDELHHCLKQAMQPDGEYDLEDIDGVLSGYWKTVRRAFDVPLIFPDEVSSLVKESTKATTLSSGETNEEEAKHKSQADDDTNVAAAITLDFFSLVSLQTTPAMVPIDRRVVLEGEEPVEIVKATLRTGTESEDLLGKFMSSATTEEKEQEKQQPGLALIRKKYILGEEAISIKDEEVAELKRRSNINSAFKSLTLLGFKNRDAVPLHLNLKSSYYVYPSDTVIEGSTVAFAHLHQSMMKKNVVGIGELLVRQTATSRLVAIHAMPEVLDGDGDQDNDDESDPGANQQKYPPGWIVQLLPFENEVRTVPADESTKEGFEVPEEVLDATEELLEKMRLQGFDLTSGFKNPYLEKFWDYIESVALQEPMPADKDYVIHRVEEEGLEALRGPVAALKASLPEDEVPTRKRAAIKMAAKNDTDWAQELRNNNLPKYPVAELKKACDVYGVKKSGKKADLVARLTEAIQREAG